VIEKFKKKSPTLDLTHVAPMESFFTPSVKIKKSSQLKKELSYKSINFYVVSILMFAARRM
jgi:hypothetical protein